MYLKVIWQKLQLLSELTNQNNYSETVIDNKTHIEIAIS